ncbi:hypothetical protein JCM39194_14580 [Desulfotomaculum varum]
MENRNAITVKNAAVKYVTSNAEKGLAFSGVDFWHMLYRTFDATISTMENI